MPPQLRSPPPPSDSIPFSLGHHRIHCAKSLVIGHRPDLIDQVPLLAFTRHLVSPLYLVPTCCVKDGKHEDAEVFLGLYLDALDEELVELRTYIRKACLCSKCRGTRGRSSISRGSDCGKARPHGKFSRVTLAHIRWKISFDRTRAKPDGHRHYRSEAWRSLKLYVQPDSIHAIQDALAHVLQPQPVQVGQSSSSEASQQVLLDALQPILILHLERFLYDAATDGINKISKPVQFMLELEIPVVGLEIMAPVSGKYAEPVHYKLMGYFTIMASRLALVLRHNDPFNYSPALTNISLDW
ncbi:hypothetical protein BJV77DRAFT_749575 [Russula vinacea]|nr:hypothetical protein BJV77DRAFT_749575 [Russula vinacea]